MSGKYNLGKSSAPREFPTKASDNSADRNAVKTAQELRQLFEPKSAPAEKKRNTAAPANPL